MFDVIPDLVFTIRPCLPCPSDSRDRQGLRHQTVAVVVDEDEVVAAADHRPSKDPSLYWDGRNPAAAFSLLAAASCVVVVVVVVVVVAFAGVELEICTCPAVDGASSVVVERRRRADVGVAFLAAEPSVVGVASAAAAYGGVEEVAEPAAVAAAGAAEGWVGAVGSSPPSGTPNSS